MSNPVYDEDKSQFADAAAITSLVVSVGTADGTVADVGGTFDQAILNDNFRDLADKINQVIVALRNAEVVALD